MSACTKKSGDSGANPANWDTAGKLVQLEKGARCPNGEPGGYLRGTCSGKWNFVPAGGAVAKSHCAFEWGPAVSCPEGTKAVGYQAVCYGVSAKDIPDSTSVSTAEDCAKSFGQTPSDPKYELICCPVSAMTAPSGKSAGAPSRTGG